MSKYKLTNLLNEYIGGGRIGTLRTTAKHIIDRMDELEEDGEVVVRELQGPSGDGKVNMEFEVVDREFAIPGGKGQERGFTVYDYKFGFDPRDPEHVDVEYDYSIGGNDIRLAMELFQGDSRFEIVKGRFMENGHVDDYADEIKEEEGIGQLYVQPAVKKEVKFHLDAYEKGDIDVDDLIQAIEDIIFGRIPAPGMRESVGPSDKAETEDDTVNIDKVAGPGAKADDYDSAVDAERSESAKEQDNVTQTTKPMYKESLKLSKVAEEMGMYIDHDDFMDEIYVARAKEIAPILKGIDMDIIVDFVKTHNEDIRGASDEEIRDEFENFRSVNYDYIDEDLQKHFKRFK